MIDALHTILAPVLAPYFFVLVIVTFGFLVSAKALPNFKIGQLGYSILRAQSVPYVGVSIPLLRIKTGRLAMKHAINREELVEKILFGYGSVGNDHPIGPGQRFFNSELAQTPYDPDKAKFYLQQAGVDSVSVELSAADAAFAGAVDAAVLYQNSAKQAGIDITVKRAPNDGYWSDVWMKDPFSAVYWGGRPVEDAMFSLSYQTGAAWNDTFYSNARFDDLLLAARAELDDDKRREMYWEMQEILNQDGGQIVPMFASFIFATTNDVSVSESFSSHWDMDGERWMERWSFA